MRSCRRLLSRSKIYFPSPLNLGFFQCLALATMSTSGVCLSSNPRRQKTLHTSHMLGTLWSLHKPAQTDLLESKRTPPGAIPQMGPVEICQAPADLCWLTLDMWTSPSRDQPGLVQTKTTTELNHRLHICLLLLASKFWVSQWRYNIQSINYAFLPCDSLRVMICSSWNLFSHKLTFSFPSFSTVCLHMQETYRHIALVHSSQE